MTGKITAIAALALGLAALGARAEAPQHAPLQTLALPADHATPLWRVQGDGGQRDSIMQIQHYLQVLGLYRGAIDGIAGSGTWGAIRQFYSIAGINPDMFDSAEFIILRRAAELHRESGISPAEAIRRAADPRLPEAYEAARQGIELHRQEDHRSAEAFHRQALSVLSELLGPAHSDTLSVANNLASALSNQGRHADAEALHREVLSAREQSLGPDHVETLRSRNNLAYTLSQQARHGEAEAMFRETLALSERLLGAEHEQTLLARNNLAEVIQAQGRYAEAEAAHREILALSIRALGPDHRETLTTRNNLAQSVLYQGRFREAEALHRENLLARARALGEGHYDTLSSRNNLADALEQQGRLGEAEALYRETVIGMDRLLGPEHPIALRIRNNLAAALNSMGRYEEATVLHREVLESRTRVLGPDHPSTLTSRSNLAVSLLGRGLHAEAEALQRETVSGLTRALGADHPRTLTARNNLASMAEALDRHDEAEALHRENLAARIRVLGAQHPDTLLSRNNLAVAIHSQGRHDESEALFRENLAAYEQVLGPEHPSSLTSRESLAWTLVHQARLSEALDVMEAGFAHLPASYATTRAIPLRLENHLGWAWSADAVPAAERAARTFPAQGYLTYGDLDVALGDVAARQQVGDAATAAALREFQEAREELQQWRRAYLASFEAESSVSEDARAQIQADLRAAEDRFSEIADRIDRDFPALAELELPRALSADEAQALLEPGEGLLAFASMDDHLYAWLVTPDAITWHRMDMPRHELAARVSFLRESLDIDWTAPPPLIEPGCALASPVLPDHPFELCAAHELHNLILGEIDLSGIDELIVVPDGPLESLPFAMLVSDHSPGATPRWLVEGLAITTLPTTSSLRALRQGGQAGGQGEGDDRLPFLGIAPQEFDEASPDSALRGTPLARLPGTADEVRFLAGLLGAGADGAVIGAQASEAFVKSAPLERYRVLSFATHGLLARETAEITDGAITEMALALRPGAGEDGLLTASEVAALRLDADWVLLSACNTAGGGGDDAQGLSGLARAFFFAGARALMVSHWYIDDQVTPVLMAEAMERSGQRSGQRSDEGLSRAQSLRQAQLAMATTPEHAHPFFWAPFSVVGENR